jgi:hypothetical protein
MKLHVLRVKHTMAISMIALFFQLNHTILLRSIGNNLLPRDAMRAKKLWKALPIYSPPPSDPETLDLLLTLSFNKSFEFLEFAKHLILGFNGVDP